jgi:hypothetical protein
MPAFLFTLTWLAPFEYSFLFLLFLRALRRVLDFLKEGATSLRLCHSFASTVQDLRADDSTLL